MYNWLEKNQIWSKDHFQFYATYIKFRAKFLIKGIVVSPIHGQWTCLHIKVVRTTLQNIIKIIFLLHFILQECEQKNCWSSAILKISKWLLWQSKPHCRQNFQIVQLRFYIGVGPDTARTPVMGKGAATQVIVRNSAKFGVRWKGAISVHVS